MMKLLPLIFVFLFIETTLVNGDIQNINIETILRSLGLPVPVRACVDPFIAVLQKSFESGDPIKELEGICQSYNNTEECMLKHNTASIANIFKIASSGVDNLCTQKWPFMEKHKECINTHAGYKFKACDVQCNMTNEMTAMSQNEEIIHLAENGGNMVKVLTKLRGICSSSRCFLPCYRNTLNASCKRAGGMIVDAMLKPFYRLAEYVENAGPLVNAFLDNNMPSTCKFLTNENILHGIRNGTILTN